MHSWHWVHPKPDPQFNDPTSVTIHHNGDYSGQAKVNVHHCAKALAGKYEPCTPQCVEVEIPAKALMAFGGESARSMIISAIEDLDLST